MSKYNGFAVDEMLTFIERRGYCITIETLREFEEEESWRITMWLKDERQVFKAGTLFGATMNAFKQFSDQATKERKEAQAALNKIMRLTRKPNHPDHELCSVCCGYGCTEAGEICESCEGSGRDEVAQ
ncbi:hypothetical protein N2M06_13460 [Oceanimonas sp. AH20CE76]|uniref:hypothetical protein n=1 Tax=Oceanimonas sp. AH20CE76 TaxID=2977120 RepID=UPI0031FE68E9